MFVSCSLFVPHFVFIVTLSLSHTHTHTNCNSMSIPKEWDDILSFCVSCHVRVAFQPNAYKKVRIACPSGTLVPCQEQPATLITSCGAYNFCKYTWQIVHSNDIMTPTFYHQPKTRHTTQKTLRQSRSKHQLLAQMILGKLNSNITHRKRKKKKEGKQTNTQLRTA